MLRSSTIFESPHSIFLQTHSKKKNNPSQHFPSNQISHPVKKTTQHPAPPWQPWYLQICGTRWGPLAASESVVCFFCSAFRGKRKTEKNLVMDPVWLDSTWISTWISTWSINYSNWKVHGTVATYLVYMDSVLITYFFGICWNLCFTIMDDEIPHPSSSKPTSAIWVMLRSIIAGLKGVVNRVCICLAQKFGWRFLVGKTVGLISLGWSNEGIPLKQV